MHSADSQKNATAERKKSWEPMKLTDQGKVRDVALGGGGKLTATAADPGDVRKPTGQA
jgi:hypothetical protein